MSDLTTGAVDYVYFPAKVRHECDSPLDALVGACVGQREAMDLVVASWHDLETGCLMVSIDGGRQLVVTLLPGGRWAACQLYLTDLCTSFQEAEQRMQKRRRYQCRGIVVKIALAVIETAGICRHLAPAGRVEQNGPP